MHLAVSSEIHGGWPRAQSSVATGSSCYPFLRPQLQPPGKGQPTCKCHPKSGMKMLTNVIQSVNHQQQNASRNMKPTFKQTSQGISRGQKKKTLRFQVFANTAGNSHPNHGKGQVNAVLCIMNRKKRSGWWWFYSAYIPRQRSQAFCNESIWNWGNANAGN